MKSLGLSFLLVITLAGCHAFQRDKLLPPPDLASLPQASEYLGSPLADFIQPQVVAFHEKNQSVAPGGIVFCGDSITAGFPFEEVLPAYPIANRGIGGDNIWGLLRRLDASAYELQPRQLYLMIGINDIFINKMTPAEYGKLYDYLFGELQRHCPGCKITVQSILPIRGRIANIESAKLNQMVRGVNQELKACARRHGLAYLDLHPLYCDEKGEMKKELSDDGVHPNRAGYELWAQVLKRSLKK